MIATITFGYWMFLRQFFSSATIRKLTFENRKKAAKKCFYPKTNITYKLAEKKLDYIFVFVRSERNYQMLTEMMIGECTKLFVINSLIAVVECRIVVFFFCFFLCLF